MKKLILIAALLVSGACYSQTSKYYFFILQDGDKGVRVFPEKDIIYPDVDSLIVSSREGKKIQYRFFKSNSEAFNTLGGAGLEFVQFTAGGGMIGNVMIWRRKL